MATGVSSTWRNHSSSGYLLVIIMETKGGCHCHAHALVHHHHRLPPPRAPTPTTHTAAPPTAQMRIFLRFLVRKWTRTGSSYVLGHADSAMTCLNNCHTSWKAVDAIKQDNKHRYSDTATIFEGELPKRIAFLKSGFRKTLFVLGPLLRKLWPCLSLLRCPIFAGRSRFAALSRLRTGITRTRKFFTYLSYRYSES